MFDNGVMTNDCWCRDETESLLWAADTRLCYLARVGIAIHSYNPLWDYIDVLYFVDISLESTSTFFLNISQCFVQIIIHVLSEDLYLPK
jgi:hypothetical protein